MAFFRKAGSMLARITTTNINQEILSSKTSVFQMIRCMSTSKIFVGGLSYNIDDRSLRETFDKYGTIDEARVLVDRETGRSRGFGFVTYTSVEEASDAIQAMDQQELEGRILKVNFANERTRGYSGDSRGGNFGGGGSSNGGGFGGGYGGGGGFGGGYNGGGGFGRGYGGGGAYNNDAYPGNAGGGGYGGGGYNNDAYPGNTGGGVYGGSSNLNSGVDGNTGSGDYRGSNSYGSQSFGIAGGAVGGNNLFSGGMDAGVDAAAPGNERFADKFSSEETNHVESASKF